MNKFLFFSIIIFYFIFSFSFASAQGLVPCKGLDCDFCDLLKLIDNVFYFAIYKIVIPLVVIMIIYGGFVIMTAGDSTDKVAQGRKIIQSSIIGVVIVLGAWMIIDQILTVIATGEYKGFKPSEIFTTGVNCN